MEQDTRASYLAAERSARAKGRLWGRWTDGYKEARKHLESTKATHHEARDRAEVARGRERAATWLASQLEERTQIAANVMSQRWTGWSCVGRWEDPISSSDVRKIAAALVIGQATVGLMLSDLISDDLHGRLLEPWHSSVSRVPWQVADDETADDRDVRVPAAASRDSTAEVPTQEAIADGDLDARLSTLLELAHQADGMERISYRDQVAAFGPAAIRPMAGWLTDPKLGAFAARVLEKIAVGTDAELVHNVLRKTLPDVSTPSVRDDIQGILRKLEPVIRLTQTQEWMAAQGSRGHGSQWTTDDAERLVKKIDRLDARRRAAGRPSLSASNWEQAVALQFRGFGSRPYTSHCWTPFCGGSIDSEINARCDACNMFFCDSCGACMCGRG